MTTVKNNKGRIQASLSEERLPEDDEHTLTVAEQADGAVRFLCGSQYDETFTGSDGEVATLMVNIPADMSPGDYPVMLKDMKLTETDISKFYETDYVESTLSIIPSSIEGVLNDGGREVQVFSLSGQRLAAPRKGINIIGGRKVVIK